MSRQARQLSERETGYYHIIMRGNNKTYIKVLKQLESEEIIQLVAWCIMDNHVHLVMKGSPMSQIIDILHLDKQIHYRARGGEWCSSLLSA